MDRTTAKISALASSMGCGNNNTKPAPICVAGQQSVCACPAGGMGAQRCRDDGSGYDECLGCDVPDMSANDVLPDLAGTNLLPDLSSPSTTTHDLAHIASYAIATPHDIDTNTIGGSFGTGAAVQLSGLIVLDPPQSFAANAKADCVYEVWAQDPACVTPPCGILILTQPITNPNGTGAFCPFESDTSTLLKTVFKGDKIDVKGVVDTFPSTATPPATGTVVQHEVILDALTQTATAQPLPTPIAVVDTNPSLFVPYSGTGWATYEGTYVKIAPASGKLTVTLDMYGDFTCAPGGAQFADTFNSFYRPDGGVANMWPPTGTMFTSVAGIVGLTFGGGVQPTALNDFVP